MKHYPEAMARLICELQKLPTVGPKTAQRLACYFLKMSEIDARGIAQSIEDDEESLTAEGDSIKLISVAFERMSDQVIMLIDARTSELAVARDEASEANLAKSKFLANMSH